MDIHVENAWMRGYLDVISALSGDMRGPSSHTNHDALVSHPDFDLEWTA